MIEYILVVLTALLATTCILQRKRYTDLRDEYHHYLDNHECESPTVQRVENHYEDIIDRMQERHAAKLAIQAEEYEEKLEELRQEGKQSLEVNVKHEFDAGDTNE